MFNFLKKKKKVKKEVKIEKKRIEKKKQKKFQIVLYFRNGLKICANTRTEKEVKEEYERLKKEFKGKGKYVEFDNSIHKKEDIITIVYLEDLYARF